jgi:membrane protein YdbS with pleckstrin-like domain
LCKAAGLAMTRLHPDQVKVLRIRAVLVAAVALIVALAFDLSLLRATPLRLGLFPGAVAAIGLVLAILLPARRYRAWGYDEREDEIVIANGIMVRTETIVPFGRVQHIDIAQGPLERRFSLGTLILHTAGTRGASVPLPGLGLGEAERLRDRIRTKIRSDLG